MNLWKPLLLAALAVVSSQAQWTQVSGGDVIDRYTYYAFDESAIWATYAITSDDSGYVRGWKVGDRYTYAVNDTVAARLVFEAGDGDPSAFTLAAGWSFSTGGNVNDRYTHAVTDTTAAMLTYNISGGGGGGGETTTRYFVEIDTLDFDTVSALRNVTQVFKLPERHEIALFATEIFEDGGEDFDLATNDDSANVAFVAGASGAGVGSSRLKFATLDTLDVYITKHGATSADSFVVAFITFDADDLDGGTHEAVAFDSTYELSVDTLTTDSSIVATLPELTDVHSLVVAIDTATSVADTMIVELGGREIARFELDVKTTMTIATPNAFTFATAALTVRPTSANTGHVRIRARGVYYEN